MSSERLIRDFYEAFARKDHVAMGACYADSATFADPVFPALDATRARAMWRMFCLRGTDLEITFSDIEATETTGSALWEAKYTFAATGRSVRNVIKATFESQDGRIIKHTDSFDFYRWAKMALGPLGIVAGWTPIIRNQVRKQAAHQLSRFMQDESSPKT